MVVELTPETYLNEVLRDGALHVIMHYGVTCGPCKRTMPLYEDVAQHFNAYGRGDRVKFYRFHQWEPSYQEFITANNMRGNGVPTFKFYYSGEVMEETTKSFNDPNDIKRMILDVGLAINSTLGGFDLDKD